ncbi:hypothetical protein M404DRAFT_25352 [Pisolithus tinctorius Marx 270]|uniref:Uncharacterized protein n=1 Tax=Pisolithus tinctorius Marx 270 TaxID=870435 RepID=A0A0C3J9C3_PISTI|nr:hypothetical protein M404DRAFT_25352 [Pisolithus tinctorius Marx 270]
MRASPSKSVINNDEVEVVESHLHVKGKAPFTEAMALQATYLWLQVWVNQLAKVLEKLGVK